MAKKLIFDYSATVKQIISGLVYQIDDKTISKCK